MTNQFLNRCQYEVAKYHNGRNNNVIMPEQVEIVSYEPEEFYDEGTAVLKISETKLTLYYCEYNSDGMVVRVCDQSDIEFVLL